MVSAFLKLEGNTVRNRIWNFLIMHSAFKEIWKDFVKRDIVKYKRNVGKAKLYILNRENHQVEKFIDYYWSVVHQEVEKHRQHEELLVH